MKALKVSELREILEALPGDCMVRVRIDEGSTSRFFYVQLADVSRDGKFAELVAE